MKKKYTFIDLFAGLGGFHKALETLGCECVFASELRSDLRKLYKINYPNTPIFGDITKVSLEDVPAHDILCAGFPCQPFSKAGFQEGFNDKERGNMFDYIMTIVKARNPQYIFLENVANLQTHDDGNTWKVIKHKLSKDYTVYDRILSPHEFGIPQHRKRIYIVCIRKNLNLPEYKFPEPTNRPCNILDIIDEDATDVQMIKKETRCQLDVWEEFLHLASDNGVSLGGFPLWTMEFGATYEFEGLAPSQQTLHQLQGKRGNCGKKIKGQTKEECIAQLPVYAQPSKRNNGKEFPDWKKKYIRQNREFYEKNKKWLKPWLKKIKGWQNSHIKFEWNCGKDANMTLEDKLVQFRASGIRVKLPNFAPALNLVGTQIPILPWIEGTSRPNSNDAKKGRYLTTIEAATLQGMQDLKFGNDEFRLTNTRIYEALGNAVNVQIVKMIAENLE